MTGSAGGCREGGINDEFPLLLGHEAAESALRRQSDHAAQIARLRKALVRETCLEVPDVSLNGHHYYPDRRLPGNANLHLPHCEGDSLVMLLDARGGPVRIRQRVSD